MHVWETRRDQLERNIAELLTREAKHTRIDVRTSTIERVVSWTDLLTGQRHVLMRTRSDEAMMRVILRITRARKLKGNPQAGLSVVPGKSLRRKAR